MDQTPHASEENSNLDNLPTIEATTAEIFAKLGIQE